VRASKGIAYVTGLFLVDPKAAVTISIFLCPANRHSSRTLQLRGAVYGSGLLIKQRNSSTVGTRPVPGDSCTAQTGSVMPDNTNTMNTAARFRERAVECIKMAAASFDPNVEAQYRSLAEQYVKLAECEEQVFQEGPG
jgi:hypothetical protein